MTAMYRLFGLNVRSEIDLPELTPCAIEAEPEVTIRLSDIGADVSAPGLHAVDGDLVFVAEDVARYRIAAGRTIVVERLPNSPARNVRLFLLGSAFGALLHQRGLLPLHANAVEIGGKAVAFMGESGAGKSTLAAWFHDNGYPVLADDVCVIGFDQKGAPRAYPGLPRLRLWLDALESSGRSVQGLSRSFEDSSSRVDKYDVPIAAGSSAPSDLPLRALYVLEQGDEFLIEQLTGVAAADAIIANTYRGAFLAAAGTQRQHWESAVELARTIPVYRLRRSKRFDRIDEECSGLLHHMAAGNSGGDAR